MQILLFDRCKKVDDMNKEIICLKAEVAELKKEKHSSEHSGKTKRLCILAGIWAYMTIYSVHK